MLYSAFLIGHSWIRWVVVAAAVLVVLRSLLALGGRRGWTPADERAARFFTSALDLQMLIGLALYFYFSPLMSILRQQMAMVMRDDAMRYWIIEHPFGMILAVVLAHVGRVRIKKAGDPRRKHRLALIFFGLALVVIAGSIPWPGTATGRPLLRTLPSEGFGRPAGSAADYPSRPTRPNVTAQ